MATIVVKTKNGNLQEHKLPADKSEVFIGRVSKNDIVLPEGIVSKRHAKLVVQDGVVSVEDLQSTCGTWINGLRISEPYKLKDGDVIYIGEYQLELEDAVSPLSEDDLEVDEGW